MPCTHHAPMRFLLDIVQEGQAKTKCNPVLHRSGRPVSQSGVLHSSQHLPIEGALLFFWACRLLVWLGSLDLLEHSKCHRLNECLGFCFFLFSPPFFCDFSAQRSVLSPCTFASAEPSMSLVCLLFQQPKEQSTC